MRRKAERKKNKGDEDEPSAIVNTPCTPGDAQVVTPAPKRQRRLVTSVAGETDAADMLIELPINQKFEKILNNLVM